VADASARLIAVCGYETKAVYDGQAAIAQSIAFSPDMVLMDLGMPGLDGCETALRIRSEPAGGKILLVAVTCFNQEQDRQRAFASGFDLHVAKPISLTTLHGLLATLYKRQQATGPVALQATDIVSVPAEN
jgi:CheY-like chemotaxis protein